MKASREHKPQQSRVMQNKIIQCKPDHLFNDIPSAFSRDIPEKFIENLKDIKEELNRIRDNQTYKVDGVYKDGENDVNNKLYSDALISFRSLVSNFLYINEYTQKRDPKTPPIIIHSTNAYPVVKSLFDNSIDTKVGQRIYDDNIKNKKSKDNDKLESDIKQWKEYAPKVVNIICQ